MTRIVVLGAGISGHTAAMHLRRKLGRHHEVVVVSPASNWNWIPSNIWVGTGKMKKEKVIFPLAPLYKKKGITFYQAKATKIFPEGDGQNAQPQVEFEYTSKEQKGEIARVEYDYLINATGPKLNFSATPGLGPDNGYTASVCTANHAEAAGEIFKKLVEEMKAGATKRIVIGTGHGTCTCQGAAFEYCFNVDHDLRQAGVRDKAELIYLTNEAALGDFGVGGMELNKVGMPLTRSCGLSHCSGKEA